MFLLTLAIGVDVTIVVRIEFLVYIHLAFGFLDVDTILFSFKLTVGRIAITNGEMTTNEAIAHFKTDKKEINEYLYCYLKCFNYQTMGSTSSIATAVNSKIIKGMPFVVPTNDELEEFHGFAAPMFAKIKANQIEIDNLTALRDTLLPKLMSGELDVSDIDF